MKFTGNGLIYNPKTKKIFANFNNFEEYETNDEDEIKYLKLAGCKSIGVAPVLKDKEPTKKELVAKAKEAGITGADRMSKEEIKSALLGE